MHGQWVLSIQSIKIVIYSKRKYRPAVKLKLDGIELDYTYDYS